MNILVTGGAGYIGSHTCIDLLNAGHSIVVVDNLSNSDFETINSIKKITGKHFPFYEKDVCNKASMKSVFDSHRIDGLIHFAGFKSVSESVESPLKYYFNNVFSTLVLCELCEIYNVNRFIFSSSATVYGDNIVPFTEKLSLLPPTNPYGETKVICEKILRDYAISNPNFSVSVLRYFNPVGAHKSGLIGENPHGIPGNLMPFICKVATGEIDVLKIFGNDYNTEDGTGVRDYIHVVDLAKGHVCALEKLKTGISVYNLGTGKGTSVLELVNTFSSVNNIEVPYVFEGRRSGDIASCYAEVEKAKNELNWVSKYGIKEMCVDAWNFEKNRK